MVIVNSHPPAKTVVVPSTPVIRELLGDPDAWNSRFPCKCEDCISRGRAILNFFVGADNLMYGEDGEF